MWPGIRSGINPLNLVLYPGVKIRQPWRSYFRQLWFERIAYGCTLTTRHASIPFAPTVKTGQPRKFEKIGSTVLGIAKIAPFIQYQ